MMSRAISLCQIAFLVVVSTCAARAQSQQTSTLQEAATPAEQALYLSPEAKQVAKQIEVTPLIERLRSGRAAGASMSLETLLERQEITEKVLAASLDVDSVSAIIDTQVEQIRAIRSDLQTRRGCSPDSLADSQMLRRQFQVLIPKKSGCIPPRPRPPRRRRVPAGNNSS